MARSNTELKELDLAALVEELRATKQEALNLRFRNATGQLDKDNAVVSLACSELSVAPASWRPPQVKVAFDGEREWMAPPLHFRISARPLWLVAPSQLARDGASQTLPPVEATASVPADTPAPGATPAPGLLPA